MSLARAVAWNTLVQVGGRGIGLVASMALNAIIIRKLGIATYGEFIAASAYVGLFMVLGESGLYLVSVRRAMQEPDRRTSILSTALGLRLLWALVPLGIAVAVAWCIPESRFPTYQPVVKRTISLLTLNEYLRLLCQFLTAIFRMHLRMDLAVLGEVGSRVVALAGVGLAARFAGGLVAVAAALITANLCNLAYAWVVSRRLETFRPALDRRLAGELLREAIVVAGVLVLSLLRGQTGTFLLSLLRSAESVGIYGVAVKVHEVMITFPGLFIALLYPVLSRLVTEDRDRLVRTFQRTFDVMLLAGVGVALEVMVLAPQVAAILGEPRATTPMRVLALGLPSVFLGMTFSHLILAEGRQRLILGLYALFALANLTANWLLIPRLGYLAVAIVSVSTETVVMASLGTYWFGVRRLRIAIRGLACIPVALAAGGIVQLAATHLVPAALGLHWRIVALAVLGTATLALYAGCILRVRLLDPELLRGLLPDTLRAKARLGV